MLSKIPYICIEHTTDVDKHKNVTYYEFWLITSGSWEYKHKAKINSCNAGQLLLFHPGQIPAFILRSDAGHCYCLHVEKKVYEAYRKQYEERENTTLNSPYLSVDLTNSQSGYLSYLLSQLVNPDYVASLLTLKHFLSNALFAFSADGWDSFGDTYTVYSLDIIRRMDMFLDLELDVAEIYDHYPISPTSLINEFKQISGGYTIVQYRHIKRMEYAAHLLAEENLPVTTVAGTLNISSLSYFSEQFRKFHGVTPRQYQANYRKNNG